MIKAEVTGLRELTAKLQKIGKGATKVARKMATKGSQILAKEIKRRAPIGQSLIGNKKGKLVAAKLLKKSIGSKVKVYRGIAVGIIGPRKGFRTQIGVRIRGKNKGQPYYQDPAKIAHLVESGHGGPHAAPAHPFQGPSFKVVESSIRSAMLDAGQKGIEDLVR